MSRRSAASATTRPAAPSHAKRNIGVVLVGLLVGWAALTIEVDLERLLDLPRGLARIFFAMFIDDGPDITYLGRSMEAMLESIWIAWVGTIIGAAISLPIGFFGARNVSSGLISNIVRQLLNAIRTIPELVLAIAIFIPIAGLGPVAGALAVGLHSVGTLGKLTAEVVEGIDPGPVEATRASGGRPLQVQRWGVLPQVLPEIVAFWLYRFEINIRAAAILGVVGAGGIGFVLSQTISFGRFPRAGVAVIVVVAATILIDVTSGYVRRRIIEGSGAKRVSGDELEQPELVAAASPRARIDTELG